MKLQPEGHPAFSGALDIAIRRPEGPSTAEKTPLKTPTPGGFALNRVPGTRLVQRPKGKQVPSEETLGRKR